MVTMRLARLALVLAVALGPAVSGGFSFPVPAAPPVLSADEQILKSARLTFTGPALLDFFRQRTTADVAPDRLAALIRRLGDLAAPVRDAAFAELASLGAAAVPGLRQAANHFEDLDRAAQARQCLAQIEGGAGAALTRAAARLLAQHRPAGATEVLLADLPFAEDESVIAEIEATLAVVAVRDGQPEPALLAALTDLLPVRRAVAAAVMCKAGGTAQHARVIPLLKDPRPAVRLSAALALADNHEAEAIPVLIDLLAELPPAQGKQAEDYLVRLAGEWAVTIPAGGEHPDGRLRRAVWAAWWTTADGPGLLNELRKRTVSDAARAETLKLIQQLGDTNPDQREQAFTGLVARGTAVAPLLYQALEHADPTTRLFAGKCLQLIEQDGASRLPGVVARLMALRKPAGAAEALLAYLPFAENESITADLENTLAVVALTDGRPDPAVVKALKDPVAPRRAAAAVVLCRAGAADLRGEVRRLLQDPEPLVRLRTALALVEARQKEAVPVLIALLGQLPPEQVWQADECLRQLAGLQAPEVPVTADAQARRKYHDAWAAWWREQGAALDLARPDAATQGRRRTLVVEQYDQGTQASRVLAYDASGRVLWQLDGLRYALDAQPLPGDRVLVAESGSSQVTERTHEGTIVWQKAVPNPLACERLPNGQTFIASRQQILLIDPQGKEVLRYNRPSSDIASAGRLPDGRTVLVTYSGTYAEVDAAGKEVKSVQVPFTSGYTQGIAFLPNGHLLVAMSGANKVAEYTLKGQVVWQATVALPSTATRLPNGHILVVSTPGRRVVELTRTGQPVWELKDNPRPWRARRY
jgi:HEAT repeat protein